jgi:3-carboxy-cis,cis-muconate cycloisomerase
VSRSGGTEPASIQPLSRRYADAEVVACFSTSASIEAWLAVERALATAQAEAGVIPADAARAIGAELTVEQIDIDLLEERTLVIGYPIVSLIEQITEASSPIVGRYLHWGATTQDIMDTGLALQLARALARMERLAVAIGDELAALVEEHRATVISGRTHARPAVPTTFGAKVAVWLAEWTRQLDRLAAARPRVLVVQLFGAAGTAAALGPSSALVRRRVAGLLGLEPADVPWHTARDGLAEITFVIASMAATCAKIAREVIELSRPEIGELNEAAGRLRGASSTMPQKANPIESEVVVGLGAIAVQLVPAMLVAMGAGHERAAGEWQIEWDVLPNAFAVGSGALAGVERLLAGLQVDADRMRSNLAVDGGLIMAEAAMMALAPALGRGRAHEIVYEAAVRVRSHGVSLADAVRDELRGEAVLPAGALDPDAYLGEAGAIADAAVARWRAARSGSLH